MSSDRRVVRRVTLGDSAEGAFLHAVRPTRLDLRADTRLLLTLPRHSLSPAERTRAAARTPPRPFTSSASCLASPDLVPEWHGNLGHRTVMLVGKGRAAL